MPSVLLHGKGPSRWWHDAVWMVDELYSMDPADPSGQISAGIPACMSRIDDTGSSWERNYPYLRPLFDTDRPVEDLGCLLLVIGLCGIDKDARGFAVDAAIESIQDGRIHPATLGNTLAKLSTPGWLKLNRLCGNLEEVARVSPLHAWVVGDSLQRLVSSYTDLPRDLHHMLSLMQNLLMQLGLPLSEQARAALPALGGGGKTAKLPKAILSLDAAETLDAREARLMIAQARFDRVSRWHATTSRLD